MRACSERGFCCDDVLEELEEVELREERDEEGDNVRWTVFGLVEPAEKYDVWPEAEGSEAGQSGVA